MKKQLALAGGIESEMEENEYLWSSQKCYYTGGWRKVSVQKFSNLFLKKIIEEAPTTETGRPFPPVMALDFKYHVTTSV